MMEQREKLIELLGASATVKITQDADGKIVGGEIFNLGEVADYLLANGVVVVLPCRCCECEYCEIGQNDVEQWCICALRYGKNFDVDPTDFCSFGKRKGGDE